MSELSIVIPILNEAKNILLLIPEINKTRVKLKIKKFEILLIDDNSIDNIKFVVKKLQKKYKYLKLFIRKNKKKDLSKSCVLGFEKASFKNILVMDGDNQHPPKYITKLFNVYSNGHFDIVVGSRDLLNKRSVGLSYIRRLFSIILIVGINYLLGNRTKDPMSGYFIFNKKIFKYINNDKTNFETYSLKKLAKENNLMLKKHFEFWQCMDTLREKIILNNMYKKNNAPWLIKKELF